MPDEQVRPVETTSERGLGPFVGLYRESARVVMHFLCRLYYVRGVTLSDTYGTEGGGADSQCCWLSNSHAGIVSTDPRPSNRLTYVYHRDITNDRDCPSQPSFLEPQQVRTYVRTPTPHLMTAIFKYVWCAAHPAGKSVPLACWEVRQSFPYARSWSSTHLTRLSVPSTI